MYHMDNLFILNLINAPFKARIGDSGYRGPFCRQQTHFRLFREGGGGVARGVMVIAKGYREV